MDDLDPALEQEDAGADAGAETVADPQATEVEAESPEESGDGAGSPPEDQDAKNEDAKPDDAEALEIVVDGIEPPPQKENAAPWLKELRKQHREQKAQIADLTRKLQTQGQPAAAPDPGPKPTPESCEYDLVRFERELDSWKDRTAQKATADALAAQEAGANRRLWQTRVDVFTKGREELSKKVADYASAEKVVESTLDGVQQSAIVAYAEKPALVVCALGQNPKLLEDLAKHKDPVRFSIEVAKLEARLKTQKKSNQPPPPEKTVPRGNGGTPGATDPVLERLRAKADKDPAGDRSAIVEYLRKKRTAS